MSRHFFYICVILLLAACRGREQDPLAFSPPVFPETKQVAVTPLPNDFLFNGSLSLDMEDMGDFMVVCGFHENKYFHVFEKESGAYVKSFGSYGRGPGELPNLPQIRFNQNDSILYVFQDRNALNDFWHYKAENVLYGNRVFPVWEDQIRLFQDEGAQYPGAAWDFLAWQDKRLFARNRLHRFEVQDTLGNTLYLYDNYPVVPLQKESDSSDFHNSYIHAGLALKPDGSRFVIASRYGCIMEVFTIDTSGKIEKEIEKRFYPPIIADNQTRSPRYLSEGQVLGINELSVTDELIFAKYNGNKYAPRVLNPPKTIAVFDWSGNPIRCYVVEWTYIKTFCIDAQRNRCYLIGVDTDEEVQLGYFDL